MISHHLAERSSLRKLSIRVPILPVLLVAYVFHVSTGRPAGDNRACLICWLGRHRRIKIPWLAMTAEQSGASVDGGITYTYIVVYTTVPCSLPLGLVSLPFSLFRKAAPAISSTLFASTTSNYSCETLATSCTSLEDHSVV